jgi:pimeloyl-ACP methyl ester carboxylesterase
MIARIDVAKQSDPELVHETSEFRVESGVVQLHIVASRSPGPTVALIPPFAMSALDVYPFSYVMALNGFRVVAINGRDNVGGGSGSIRSYRLSTVAADTAAVVEHTSADLVVALSLSCRPVLRLLPQLKVKGAVLATPVVDVRKTLDVVLGTDYFSMSERPAEIDVLGHVVAHSFLDDCIDANFVDLATTSADIAKTSTPIAFICGSDDAWVKYSDVQGISAAAKVSSYEIINGASHELTRHPLIALEYVRRVVARCAELAMTGRPVVMPPFQEIIRSAGHVRRVQRRRSE